MAERWTFCAGVPVCKYQHLLFASRCLLVWGSHHYYKISRTWTQRITVREAKWDLQPDALVQAYVAWKHDPSPIETTNSGFTVQFVDIYGQLYYFNPSPSLTRAVDCQHRRSFKHISAPGSQYWNVTLRHGCLASTPDCISSVPSFVAYHWVVSMITAAAPAALSKFSWK